MNSHVDPMFAGIFTTVLGVDGSEQEARLPPADPEPETKREPNPEERVTAALSRFNALTKEWTEVCRRRDEAWNEWQRLVAERGSRGPRLVYTCPACGSRADGPGLCYCAPIPLWMVKG